MKNFRTLLIVGFVLVSNAYDKDDIQYGNYTFTYKAEGEDNLEWCNAMVACSVLSTTSSLAILSDAGTDDAVLDMLDGWGAPTAWIGGTDLRSADEWLWLNGGGPFGSGYGYSNWGDGQPDSPSEDCLEVNYTPHKWNNNQCSVKQGYVCQRDIRSTTVLDFTELAFSTSFSVKEASSVEDAKAQCKSRGMKLLHDGSNEEIKKMIKQHDPKIDPTKYITENGCVAKTGYQVDAGSCENLNFICEAARPHHLKISDKAPKIAEHGNIIIDCSASGYPVPEVHWEKDGEVISTDNCESTHQVQSEGSSSLVIPYAEPGDEGRYRCFAKNSIHGEKRSLRTFVDLEVTKSQEKYY